MKLATKNQLLALRQSLVKQAWAEVHVVDDRDEEFQEKFELLIKEATQLLLWGEYGV